MRGALGGSARALALLAALALAGCASMSQRECRTADWEAVGRADGVRGAPPEELDQHRRACARYKVEPQEQAWREGYAKGIEDFCTPKGGYIAGRSGTGHRQTCTGKPQESGFLVAYRRGQEVNALLREVNALHRVLRDIEIAAASGEYTDYELGQVRLRATELSDTLRRRQWELEKLDGRYAVDYAAPLLTDADMQRVN